MQFGVGVMDVYETRKELRRMDRGDLLRLVSEQRISRCLIGGQPCGLYMHYKGFNFCISEIIGEGCQLKGMKKMGDRYEGVEEINYPLPLAERPGMGPLQKEERNVVFRVYCRNYATRSMVLLGKVIERRTKERGNNLKDLLVRAVKDYSGCVEDPSMIFLWGP
jgi:hypothetical protein